MYTFKFAVCLLSGPGAALQSGVRLLWDPWRLHHNSQPWQHAAELLPLGDTQVSRILLSECVSHPYIYTESDTGSNTECWGFISTYYLFCPWSALMLWMRHRHSQLHWGDSNHTLNVIFFISTVKEIWMANRWCAVRGLNSTFLGHKATQTIQMGFFFSITFRSAVTTQLSTPGCAGPVLRHP